MEGIENPQPGVFIREVDLSDRVPAFPEAQEILAETEDRPHLTVETRVVSNETQTWMVFDVVDQDGNVVRTIGEDNPPTGDSLLNVEPELKTEEDKYNYRLGIE